jgi:hypothetical protein
LEINGDIYSFYFSLTAGKILSAKAMYFFIALTAIVLLLFLVFGITTGFYLFIIYPLLFLIGRAHLQVDTKRLEYRYAFFIAGFNFGKWEKLPPVQFISVFKAIYINRKHRPDSEFNLNEPYEKIEVNLVMDDKNKINVWLGNNKKKAFYAAKILSKKLNLKILDATQKPFVWLD